MSDGAALTVPPAGWYPDRSEANVVRWWDGQQWTDQTQSTAPAAAAFEQPVSVAAFGFVPAAAPWTAPAAAATMTPAHNIAPGWYPDNHDPSLQRWWDGTQWTAHTTPTVASGPSTQLDSRAAGRPVTSRGNTMATMSLAISIVSFAGLIFVVLLPLALAGVIMGIVALRRIPLYAPTVGRRGQAVAGIIVGTISLVVTILLTVAALVTYEQLHPPVGSQSVNQQSSPQTNGGTDSTGSTGSTGGYDGMSAIEHQIAVDSSQLFHVDSAQVVCPIAASLAAGSTFTCSVTLDDGRIGAAQVKMLDDGGFQWAMVEIPTGSDAVNT